jgi:outer membrane protein assembly factor BamE (lipoprotein component of BamABCDE complex)
MKAPCLAVLSVALVLTACAPGADRLNRLRVGMTRDEATKAIGRPVSTTAQAGREVLLYQFTDKPFGDGMIFPGTYYVTVDNGRVSGWSRDEVKDRLDHERAYRINAMGMAPPVRVDENVNVSGNVNVHRQ